MDRALEWKGGKGEKPGGKGDKRGKTGSLGKEKRES